MFQMQSFEGRRDAHPSDDSGWWEPMENGAAANVWRPRATAAEAIRKCVQWTGGIGIPAMQVVDLDTGTIVWRDSTRYWHTAGRPIPDDPREWERLTNADKPCAFRVRFELRESQLTLEDEHFTRVYAELDDKRRRRR